VHLQSTDKSHAKTVFPPAETWSSKSNYSKLPRTSKDGVPSFIPTPIRTASKISHSSLGNSTPVKLPTTDKRKTPSMSTSVPSTSSVNRISHAKSDPPQSTDTIKLSLFQISPLFTSKFPHHPHLYLW
jgi:hypothetical protein